LALGKERFSILWNALLHHCKKKKELMNRIKCIALAIAMITVSGAYAATPSIDELTKNMDQAIDSAIAQNRIVGTVVLVEKDGRIIYHRAAGFADREIQKPMTEDTIFRLTSVSKPIATAAVLRLIDNGFVKLDDPVTKWLPNFQPKYQGVPQKITIRQLLTHTSGLGYTAQEELGGPYHRARVSDGAVEAPGNEPTLAELVDRLSGVPLRSSPGQKFNYSLSIDVLGQVAAVVTGKPLPAAIAELVTKPLGMKDTTFVVTEKNRLAANYYNDKQSSVRMNGHTVIPLGPLMVGLNPNRNTDATVWPSAGAGMSGTAGDVMILLETLRRGGGKILSKEAVVGMMSAQVGAESQANGPGWGFGYGGAVLINPAEANSPQTAGTYSWSGAYGHTWFVDPTDRVTVVAMTNTAFEGMIGKFAVDVRNAVYHAPGQTKSNVK
jgi:CubicO group peptidase (beta-lactamase class C family)